jgi:hypothetical protein
MMTHYPIVLETEASGAVSAYVPGCRTDARVRVARLTDRQKTKVDIVGVAALVGARRSATKARASRANGRLGGRPRKAGTAARRAKASR